MLDEIVHFTFGGGGGEKDDASVPMYPRITIVSLSPSSFFSARTTCVLRELCHLLIRISYLCSDTVFYNHGIHTYRSYQSSQSAQPSPHGPIRPPPHLPLPLQP